MKLTPPMPLMSSAASDLGLMAASTPSQNAVLTDEERRRKLLEQAQGSPVSPLMGAYMSLTGNQF